MSTVSIFESTNQSHFINTAYDEWLGGKVPVNLIASDIITSAAVLGAPVLGHIYNLGAGAIVADVPIVGAPELTAIVYISALSVETAAPVITAPTIRQDHHLAPSGIVTPAPVIQPSQIHVIYHLVANNITAQPPVFTIPEMIFFFTTVEAFNALPVKRIFIAPPSVFDFSSDDLAQSFIAFEPNHKFLFKI